MRKIIISLILIITLISFISTSFAFGVGEIKVYSKGECPRLLTYKGTPIRTTFIAFTTSNGYENPAYCLDVTLPGAEEGEYLVSGNETIQNVEVWRAIINGYPYKSLSELGAANEQEAFAATKQAVYTMLQGRNIEDYGPVDSDAGRRTYEIYKNIVNNARNSNENIENITSTRVISIDDKWNIDEKQKEYVSRKYKVSSAVKKGDAEIFLEGNLPKGILITDLENNPKINFSLEEEFKILIPINSQTEDGGIDICARVNLESKPVVYGRTMIAGRQDYALTGYWHEEIFVKTSQEYNKNTSKLKIIKKEYGTETLLSNVKFNLLDENKNPIYTDLITNNVGEIIIENMIPGKYYLQEVETLEEYNLYTDLIEINLDFNEEFIATVNNTKKEVEVYEKSFENIEVVPTNKESYYYNSNSNSKIESNTNTTTVVFEENNLVTKNTTNETLVKKLPKTGY